MLRLVEHRATVHGADHLSARHARRALQRQRRLAERAFRHDPPDEPMGVAAARAVVGFMLAIDDVIAPFLGQSDDAAAPRLQNTRRHVLAPSSSTWRHYRSLTRKGLMAGA